MQASIAVATGSQCDEDRQEHMVARFWWKLDTGDQPAVASTLEFRVRLAPWEAAATSACRIARLRLSGDVQHETPGGSKRGRKSSV